MTAALEQLLDELDNRRNELRAAVDAVPAELRERRPAPDRWSVAENVEHLALVERRVTQGLAAQLSARASSLGPADDQPPRSFRAEAAVDRSRRFKTGGASEPKAQMDTEAAWRLIQESRSSLLELIHTYGDRALHEITQPHPLFGPLNAYDWFAFLAAHDARHAAQIREAAEALK